MEMKWVGKTGSTVTLNLAVQRKHPLHGHMWLPRQCLSTPVTCITEMFHVSNGKFC
jgi:phenolic acid decarboxylase